jgi:hypothetical protein
VVGEDLQARPHDEQHEKHVEEVLELQPPGEAGIDRRRGLRDTRMLMDEDDGTRKLPQALRQGDQAEQARGTDREGPERAHPALADPDAWNDPWLRCHPMVAAHPVVGVGESGAKRFGSVRSRNCGHLAIAFWYRAPMRACRTPSFLGADTNTFFTIGHSTRTIAEFADLLREASVDLVVDVRSIPRSRTNPQFNRDTLPASLAPWQIGYEHIAALGGLRGTRGAAPSPNGYWQVMSFRNFADYALTPPFAAGLAQLRELGGRHRCAIMCAEAVWWRCHRRIIAEYLLAAGEEVFHILGSGHLDAATLTPGAVVQRDGTVVYPAETSLDPAAHT